VEIYKPGFHIHFIQAKKIGQTPWGWRPGVVSAVEGQTATVSYVQEDGDVTLWHHAPLDDLEVGLPVRVHEQSHVLETVGSWRNVALTGGLGPVPEPEHPDLWEPETDRAVITDLGTGRGVRDSSFGTTAE
jgi:hypothetical protein